MEEVIDTAEQLDESVLARVDVFDRLKTPHVKIGCTTRQKIADREENADTSKYNFPW